MANFRNAPALKIEKAPGNIVITLQGTLQVADAVNGPYADVPGSSPATVPTSGSAKFYRAVRNRSNSRTDERGRAIPGLFLLR